MGPVYLDYNATTPVAKEVADAIYSTLTEAWGNPSSSYEIGQKAKSLIEESRKQIGRMIGAPESTITFTSGGTESNNLVIHSATQYYLKHLKQSFNTCQTTGSDIPNIITSNIEHDSILKPLRHMFEQGLISLSIVPVSKMTGCVTVDSIVEQVREETCLVTIMMANNETGLIQPIEELGKKIESLNRVRKIPILFHTDAAQTVGKIDVSVNNLGVHFMTIVGHKFYGPRIGAVYIKTFENAEPILSPLFFGGGQERGFRPGTENTAMIVGLGKAADLVSQYLAEYEQKMCETRNYLEKQLKDAFKDKIEFNNHRNGFPRLPNTTSVSFLFDHLTGSEILKHCVQICASTGAACHSGQSFSTVLKNSGVNEYLAMRTIRFSVGRETTHDDIDACVSELKSTIFIVKR